MKAIERLKRDHTLLRSKLDVLESALRMGPETWFVLREVCFTLGRQLEDHIRREEALVAACRQALSAEELKRMDVEHHDEPQLLATVNQLFLEEGGHSLERIRPRLEALITGLRQHMTEEEEALFPTLSRVVEERHVAAPVTSTRCGCLQETATVNRIIQEHPRTRPVFERLYVNIPCEGVSCLDEVAWRHGMEPKELLAALGQAMAPSSPYEEVVAGVAR